MKSKANTENGVIYYRNWKKTSAVVKYVVTLIRDMDNLYTHQYQACHQAIEDGVELDLSTEGEYISMSEDAL